MRRARVCGGGVPRWRGPCRFPRGLVLFRADAKRRYFALQDRELCAGERLRLAGFSAGTGVGARGGWAARVGFGMRNWGAGMRVFGDAVLAGRLALGLPCHCGSVAAFDIRFTLSVWFCRSVCLGSRLLFDAQRQTGRLAICSVPVPQVEIAIRAFSRCRRGYRAWLVHFGIVCLFAAISTGCRGRGDGAGGAALVRLCAAILTLLGFPRGVRWGCAPQTAPKSLRLSELSSRCGGIVLVRIRGAVTRAHGKT